MNVASIIVTAASGVVVLGGAFQVVKKVFDFFQRLGKAMENVDKRSKQLETNGGSSMLDQVKAMKKEIAEQSLTLAEQSAVIAELQRRPSVRLRRRG